MTTATRTIEELANREYKYGFVTDIEVDDVPPGLNEDVIRHISAKKNEPEWLLEWRLKAYRGWLNMKDPDWANVHYDPIDYQAIIYYSAPKKRSDAPKSLDEVDPKLLETYDKLGIPLRERELLAGVAVDAVFDSVSVATTYKAKLAEVGIIFCSFSEAVIEHPELVKKYLGLGCAVHGQLLCGPELRGLHRRLVRLHSEGCPLPHGAVDLLPDQRFKDRPVRADAHHRG
jgi:Fe-S cluster assembly protein SufB